WNTDRLARKDQVRVLDLVAVGLEQPRPQVGVAVLVLRDGRQRVARLDGVLLEAVVRVDQRRAEGDRHDDLVQLGISDSDGQASPYLPRLPRRHVSRGERWSGSRDLNPGPLRPE